MTTAVAMGARASPGATTADVVIEAVGVPESFELCTRIVRPGGRLANVGVHGAPATLHLEDLWSRNVTITTGLVDTNSTPTLLRMMAAGRLPAASLVTHSFELHDKFNLSHAGRPRVPRPGSRAGGR